MLNCTRNTTILYRLFNHCLSNRRSLRDAMNKCQKESYGMKRKTLTVLFYILFVRRLFVLVIRNRDIYFLNRAVLFNIGHWACEPVNASILRKVIIEDTQANPATANDDRIIHRLTGGIWARRKHDNNDCKDVPESSSDCNGSALRRIISINPDDVLRTLTRIPSEKGPGCHLAPQIRRLDIGMQ